MLIVTLTISNVHASDESIDAVTRRYSVLLPLLKGACSILIFSEMN